jgi:peptide/nickel transport system ATP-binding protein
MICDEILSALDTVVASSILMLLHELRRTVATAYLFISHDLSTIGSISDRVIVLYAGRMCEVGPTRQVFAAPRHPYTAMLLSSIPELRQGWFDETLDRRQNAFDGSMARVPRDVGCPFRTRCPHRIVDLCDRVAPPARILPGNHVAYCHLDLTANATPVAASH